MSNKKEQQEPPPKTKRRNKEKLSLREIEDLMNMHADTYRRGKGGAIRRK